MPAKLKLIIILFLIADAIALAGYWRTCQKESGTTAGESTRSMPGFAPEEFPNFDEQLFFTSLKRAADKKEALKAGIIPHHQLAGELISDFFGRIDPQKAQRVIILSPNHFESGNTEAIISDSSFPTPFGRLEPDSEAVKSITIPGLAETDNKVIKGEPGIQALLPYVKFYLPDAKIVPVIFSRNISVGQLKTIERRLKPVADDPGTILVASVDFAHYGTCDEAVSRDAVTRGILERRDPESLFNLTNRFLDSPASVFLAYRLFEGSHDPVLVRRTDGCELLGQRDSNVTSYFEIIFYPVRQVP